MTTPTRSSKPARRIEIRPFDTTTIDDCRWLAKWGNDQRIRPFFLPCFKREDQHAAPESAEALWERLQNQTSSAHRFMILLAGEPIGEMNFIIDAPPILSAKKHTAWIGLVIGEASARGKGYGSEALSAIESLAREAGARQIELGVFEFNDPAMRLYERSGYEELARIENFTWYQDQTWDDIRMIKKLK